LEIGTRAHDRRRRDGCGCCQDCIWERGCCPPRGRLMFMTCAVRSHVNAHPHEPPCRPTTWRSGSGTRSVDPECPHLPESENPASLRPRLQHPFLERKTSGEDASAGHGRSSTLAMHHVAHRAGFQSRQVLLVESGFDILGHFSFGPGGQYQLFGFMEIERLLPDGDPDRLRSNLDPIS
jgi:hypothetical protein